MFHLNQTTKIHENKHETEKLQETCSGQSKAERNVAAFCHFCFPELSSDRLLKLTAPRGTNGEKSKKGVLREVTYLISEGNSLKTMMSKKLQYYTTKLKQCITANKKQPDAQLAEMRFGTKIVWGIVFVS